MIDILHIYIKMIYIRFSNLDKIMKKQILTIGFSVLVFCSNLSALTLEEAISESLTNNLSLKMEDSSLIIAEEELYQSKADFLPTLVLSGTISETETSGIISQGGVVSSDYELSPSSKSIILSQTIFNGFGRTYNIQSSRAEFELQKLNKIKVQQDIALETIEAYFNILVSEKSLKSYEDNFKTVSERLSSTKKEFEVGLSSTTDVAQAEAHYNAAKIDLLSAKISHQNAKNAFKDLVGVDAKNLSFSNINGYLPKSFSEFKDLVTNNNLSIQMAKSNLDIKSSDVGVAKSAYYPQVNLTASKTELDEFSSLVDEITSEEIEATISWPIFNKGKSSSTVRQAEQLKNKHMILLQKTQQDTMSLASNIWDMYSISKETLDAASLSYEASQTAFQGTKIEQEVGERTVLDVLNARQSLLNAEIKFFNEQKNQEVIKAQVMYLAGILTLENIKGS